jgi:hypothetical protein
MSPIGRVFIVLNLALAGGFVAFAGTHLQQQHNYKDQLQEATKEAAKKEQELGDRIKVLESDLTTQEVAKTQFETQLNTTRDLLENAKLENQRLDQQLATIQGDIQKLQSAAQAANTLSATAHTQAQAAYKMAMEDQKLKDEAIRAKDAALADNRALNNKIATLESTISTKDVTLAGLEKERNELNLLVSVAQENGFVPGLAAPALSGTVAHVANNRLCTIKITDNPGDVDIADQLAKRKFSFAIYDASGYKGEAIATDYHASDNAVTCRLQPHKGEIKAGDNASTKTP